MPLVIDAAALSVRIDDEIVRSDRGFIDDGQTGVSYSRALTGQGRSLLGSAKLCSKVLRRIKSVPRGAT